MVGQYSFGGGRLKCLRQFLQSRSLHRQFYQDKSIQDTLANWNGLGTIVINVGGGPQRVNDYINLNISLFENVC